MTAEKISECIIDGESLESVVSFCGEESVIRKNQKLELQDRQHMAERE